MQTIDSDHFFFLLLACYLALSLVHEWQPAAA